MNLKVNRTQQRVTFGNKKKVVTQLHKAFNLAIKSRETGYETINGAKIHGIKKLILQDTDFFQGAALAFSKRDALPKGLLVRAEKFESTVAVLKRYLIVGLDPSADEKILTAFNRLCRRIATRLKEINPKHVEKHLNRA